MQHCTYILLLQQLSFLYWATAVSLLPVSLESSSSSDQTLSFHSPFNMSPCFSWFSLLSTAFHYTLSHHHRYFLCRWPLFHFPGAAVSSQLRRLCLMPVKWLYSMYCIPPTIKFTILHFSFQELHGLTHTFSSCYHVINYPLITIIIQNYIRWLTSHCLFSNVHNLYIHYLSPFVPTNKNMTDTPITMNKITLLKMLCTLM